MDTRPSSSTLRSAAHRCGSVFFAACALLASSSCAKNGTKASSQGGAGGLDVKVTFPLKSEDFPAGGAVPVAVTCDGKSESPQLAWDGSFGATKSFALIADDPDAPGGDFTHWVLFDIPAATTSLPRAVTDVGVPGTNGFDSVGYGAPCPPKGKGPHRYFFRVYALDVSSLGLKKGAARAEVESAMAGHLLAGGEVMGTFEH